MWTDRRTDGRTDRHEEANSRSSQFSVSSYKAEGAAAPVHVVGAHRVTRWGECSASRSTALPLVPIKQETGWALEPVKKLWRKTKVIGAGRNGTIAPPRFPVESQTLHLLSYSGALPLQSVYYPVLWPALCYPQ